MADLSYLDAVILGVVEGLTEYLPVSSTAHLTITEKLLGLSVDDPAVTAYTAVIQLGAIAATLLYFFRDIVRFVVVWFRGLLAIEGTLRSLWVIAIALLLWSVVMVVAERVYARYEARGRVRDEHSVGPVDGLVIGLVQCFSLIPGVSRSGATISAGIMRGINRVTATRLSFFLAIPALTAAGLFQAVQEKEGLTALGLGAGAVGLVIAFVVALASIAWLLRVVATNSLMAFVWYRVALGVVLAALLGAGIISAT